MRSAVALVLLCAGVAFAAEQIVEAEKSPASDSKVVADAKASGGKAVSNGKSWQPLATVPTPGSGEEITVSIRHKGGPVQMKVVSGDVQNAKDWVWDKPG
jgi:hypothetical protein